MPKSPKVSQRHSSLTEEYAPSHPYKIKAPKKRKNRDEEETGQNNVVDTKSSRKILSLGTDLAAEDEQLQASKTGPSPFDFGSRFNEDQLNGSEPEEQNQEDVWEDEDEIIEVDETDPNDLDIFNKFNPPTFDDPLLHSGLETSLSTSFEAPITQPRNLADIILAKIAEVESGSAQVQQLDDFPEEEPVEEIELSPKVIQVYTQIGNLMSRHRSGALPKAFKIIPTLPFSTQSAVLPLTRPETWTPQAIYQATRLFISGPGPTALSFCSQVLLDRVRADIADSRKLNVHLYDALRKSLYKPAAFFKGILFPLLQSGSATLREAAILASVLTRESVPVLHAAAAMARLCDIAAEQMRHDPDGAAAANVLIKTLLEKRYALPYQTVDALVFHFLRFRPQQHQQQQQHQRGGEAAAKLPVVWHQCLLVFAQRYKNEISEEQREALLDLLLVRGHKDIAPEVRRELLAGRGKGTIAPPPPMPTDGDDTLMGGI